MNREQQQRRNTDLEAAVVRRHDQDHQDFAQIGRELDISRERARYIYQRWADERRPDEV